MNRFIISIFLAICFLLSVDARASENVSAIPNRAPNFVGTTGWVRSQETQLGSFEAYDNCLTYPLLLPVAPPDTIAVTYRMKPDYAYAGDCFVGSTGSPTQFGGGSWNCLPLSHYANAVPHPWGGPNPCPTVTGAVFDAPTAGAANNFGLLVWPIGTTPPAGIPAGAASFRTEILAPSPVSAPVGFFGTNQVPAYQVRNYWDVQEWKTVNGTRAGRDFHRLWMTPITDPDVFWTNVGGGQSYSHSVAYDMHVEARMTLAVWFITAADVAANPAVLAP